MKTFHLFPLLAVSVSTAWAQPDILPPVAIQEMPVAPRAKVRSAIPEQQVKDDIDTFVLNLNRGLGFMGNFRYVSGANVGYYGANDWAKSWRNYKLQLVLKTVNVDKIDKDMATLSVTYQINSPLTLDPQLTHIQLNTDMKENLTLKSGEFWGDKAWQIVPVAQATDLGGKEQYPFFSYVVAALAQKYPVPRLEELFGIVKEAPGKHSLENLKQLGLATMQFVQDYDEIYAFLPEYAQEALMPYLRNSQIFLIPDSETPYTFNANLSRKTIAEIKEVSRTILFYEGSNEQPEFRYDGKAAIGYVDGHVKLVTPEELKDAIWKP